MAADRLPSNDDEMPLIDSYLEWLRQRGRLPTTIKSRRYTLTRLDSDLPHGLIRANTDELAAAIFRAGWGANTRDTYYSAVVSLYAWATDPRDPWLDYNPAENLPDRPTIPRGLPRPVTDEQLVRILTAADEPYRLWSRLAAYQGLRCCEISRLDREDITEQTTYVRGKGGRPRVGLTDPGVWAAVRDFPPGPIARTPDGQRATPGQVSINSALYFRRALKMPGVSMHRLRHWLGCTVQARYRDVRVTQELLGHASLQSTQIYTAATAEQQRAALATLPRFG